MKFCGQVELWSREVVIRFLSQTGLLDWAKKARIELLLAAVGSLKFGFGALLLFGLLFETLATSSGDLGWVFVGYFFVLLLQNQSIHGNEDGLSKQPLGYDRFMQCMHVTLCYIGIPGIKVTRSSRSVSVCVTASTQFRSVPTPTARRHVCFELLLGCK